MTKTEAINVLKDSIVQFGRSNGKTVYGEALNMAIEALAAQPELIRCKDCKHWGKRGLCEKWDYYIINEDFYCGCAERRTDECMDV